MAETAVAEQPSQEELDLVATQAWFYLGDDGERQGPLEVAELIGLVTSSVLATDTPVWCVLLLPRPSLVACACPCKSAPILTLAGARFSTSGCGWSKWRR